MPTKFVLYVSVRENRLFASLSRVCIIDGPKLAISLRLAKRLHNIKTAGQQASAIIMCYQKGSSKIRGARAVQEVPSCSKS